MATSEAMGYAMPLVGLLAISALVAGAGWRRLASALLIGVGTAVAVGSLIGWGVFRASLAFDTAGGEWRALGPLIVGAVAGLLSAAAVLLAMIVWLIRTRRDTFRRGPSSWALVGAGAVGVAALGIWLVTR